MRPWEELSHEVLMYVGMYVGILRAKAGRRMVANSVLRDINVCRALHKCG